MFMDYTTLERQGADIQTKLDTIEKENIDLRKTMQDMKSKMDKYYSHKKKRLGIT
jgi:cell division protein FtsB